MHSTVDAYARKQLSWCVRCFMALLVHVTKYKTRKHRPQDSGVQISCGKYSILLAYCPTENAGGRLVQSAFAGLLKSCIQRDGKIREHWVSLRPMFLLADLRSLRVQLSSGFHLIQNFCLFMFYVRNCNRKRFVA